MTRQLRSLSRADEMRLFAGVTIQPFLAGLVAFFVFPLLWLDSTGSTLSSGIPADIVVAARALAIGTGLVAFFITLIGALPIAVWLMKRKRVSLREALFYGVGLGNVPFLVGTVFLGAYGVTGFVRGIVFSSLLGITGAAAFWIIVIRGSRDI